MRLIGCEKWVGLLCGLCIFSALNAQEANKVLTLKAALETVEAIHPDLGLAQAERDTARADLETAASRRDSSIYFEGILRSGSHTNWTQDMAPDNSMRLIARKTLYDFGRSSAAVRAGFAELNAREADLVTALSRRRIEVTSRFFEVLLADMQYAVTNELSAVIFVTFSHGQENFAAGKISSIELAELDTRNQDMQLKRNASSQRQRISRALLANAMSRPGELTRDLEEPKLEENNRLLPEYDSLIPVMLANNPRLIAQQELILAAQHRLESMRAERNPTLDAEIQAADFSRTAATRDNLSAGLILSWPLYQGSRADSRVSRELAQVNKAYATTEKLKMDLTQLLLETYLEIVQLQGEGRRAAKKLVEYRDLALERTRGWYELELKSNLGTSMAETADANVRLRKNEYQLALEFARLEAILGKPLDGLRRDAARNN